MPPVGQTSASALLERSAFAEAALACQRAIESQPDDAGAHLDLIVALEGSGQVEAAIPIYRAAFRLQPNRADLRFNLGIIVERLGRIEEAAVLYQEAAAGDPSSSIYLVHQGRALTLLGRSEAAIEAYRACLAIDPNQVEVLSSLGTVLVGLKRYEEAAAASRRAHELMPDNALVANNHAVVLHQQGRVAEAAQIYRAAIAIDPGYHSAWANLGVACQELFRFDDAVAALEQAVALRPDHPASLVELIKIRRHICDWSHYAEDHARLLKLVDEPNDASSMLLLMAFPSTAKQQLTCARHQMARINALTSGFDDTAHRPVGSRLRVGYLSADYRDHPVGRLLPEMLAQHDRRSVEVFGYALGLDDPGRVRRRIARACDHFVDLHHLSDQDAARRIRADGIDVLVDLTGPMIGARMEILARRPAPIQVSFLGWPGTTGADCIDYVIGDPLLTPAHHQTHYAEKIVQMPICYQPSDPYRASSKPNLTRAECGLPDDAFVFCSFNNTLEADAGGLRPLAPGLWLEDPQQRAVALQQDAEDERQPQTVGRSPRHRWQSGSFSPRSRRWTSISAGCVSPTCSSTATPTMPARPATMRSGPASPFSPVLGKPMSAAWQGALLRAAELPELITGNLADYEALALRLATEPGLAGGLSSDAWRIVATAFRSSTCPNLPCASKRRSIICTDRRTAQTSKPGGFFGRLRHAFEIDPDHTPT